MSAIGRMQICLLPTQSGHTFLRTIVDAKGEAFNQVLQIFGKMKHHSPERFGQSYPIFLNSEKNRLLIL